MTTNQLTTKGQTMLATEHVTKDNAHEIALDLTSRIHASLQQFKSDDPGFDEASLRNLRRARLMVFERYEELYSEELLDELLDDCDRYFNQLSGIN